MPLRIKVSLTEWAGLRITSGRLRLGAGSDCGGLRTWACAGFGRCSVQFQWQRPGFMLLHHLDGPKHNHAVSIVLRKPTAGELKVLGPSVSLLNGRVKAFDGGKHFHYVTQVEGRARLMMLLQRCSTDARHPE